MVETGIGKKGCGNLGVFLKYIQPSRIGKVGPEPRKLV